MAIILVGVVTTSIYLFVFPNQQDKPIIAEDINSTQQGIQMVVNSNNQFAFDYYNKLSEKESRNLFYSPYSISSALAMTYEGAKCQTADEMKSVFHFPENSILRPNFAAIYNEINSKNNEY